MCTSRSQNGQVRRMKSIESHSGLYYVLVTRLAGKEIKNGSLRLLRLCCVFCLLFHVPGFGMQDKIPSP